MLVESKTNRPRSNSLTAPPEQRGLQIREKSTPKKVRLNHLVVESATKHSFKQGGRKRTRAGPTFSATDLADGLRNLVDKAYPELEDKAKEQLALNHFLSQIENPHVAFSVRQKRPKTVDEAVSATLEMESYLDLKTVCKVDASNAVDTVEDPKPIGVNAMTSVPDMMKQVMDRLEKLEARIDRPTSRALDHTRTPLTCWNCGKRGHIARSCRTTHQRQGNGKPSMD